MKYRGPRLLLILLFLVIAGSTSVLLHRSSPSEGDAEALLLRLSGALRIFIVDALWLQMSTHLSEGKESLVLSDARILLRLEPGNPRIRYFLHWHLAFNMARKATTEESRAEWIKEGMEIMEEGLAQDPDSFVLNRGMGMTFLMRSRTVMPGESYEPFRRICFERYGHRPVELAPVYFERAYQLQEDHNTLRFFVISLMYAAHFMTEEEKYSSAARLWKKILDYLSPWLEATLEGTDREEFRRYIEDLFKYCRLMNQREKEGEGSVDEAKKIEALRQSIRANRFCDIWNG